MRLGRICGYSCAHFDKVKQQGLSFVEICTNNGSEAERFIESKDAIKREIARTGLDVSSVGRWNHDINTKGYIHEERMALYMRELEAAMDLGAKTFVCGCNRDDSVSLDGIKELHDRVRKYRFVRDRERLYDILVSWQSVPYVFYMGDRFAGWALVKENRTVTEIVIDPGLSCFKDAVYLLMRGRSGLDFTVPEHDKDTCDALFEYAETVYVGADLCFNVLNYEKMLSLLLELKSTYESLADGELTLQINGFAGKETLKITVEKGIPRVEKYSGQPELVLEHLDALRLFFMHKAPARSTLSPVPRSWLPLSIYVYSADNA